MSDGKCFQESPEQKAVWLADAEKRMPLGTRVRVVASDLDVYVGARGVVVGHDVGHDGQWPLVSVEFDAPVNNTVRDGFYSDGASDDEIVKE